MDSYNNVEQEIDLKELMFAVLRKWRPIILVAIIFAILLGGFKIAKGFMQMNDAEYVADKAKENEANIDQYNSSKNRLENEVENLKASIANQQEYIEKSILMNISPYDKYVSTADIYISTDYQIMPGMTYQNINTAASILKSYMSIAQNGEMYNYVLKQMDNAVELRYLQEVIKVEPDYNNNILNVTVVAANEKDAKRIMRLILACMEEGQDEIIAAIGEHQFNIVNQSNFVTVDLDLDNNQKNQSKKLEQLETSLNDKTKELDDLKEPESVLVSKRNIAKGAIKYGILGGVLGGFMMVFFSCVAFLMSDKLYSERALRRRFGLMVLGSFTGEDKKKAFAFVDKWLDKMEGVADKKISDEATYEVIAANALNYVENASTVLLVGTTDGEFLEDLRNELSGLLDGVEIILGGNIIRDASAIKKVSSCDAVIMVEERKRSTFADIEQEMDLVRSLDKKVIGCIVK